MVISLQLCIIIHIVLFLFSYFNHILLLIQVNLLILSYFNHKLLLPQVNPVFGLSPLYLILRSNDYSFSWL